MSVYIACDKCDKRLKIPDEVVGRAIKCPVCGNVFKSTPEMVQPAKAAAIAPVASAPVAHHEDDDEDLPKPRKKAAALDGDEEAIAPTRKRAVARDEDEEGIAPARKRAAVKDEDDEDAQEVEEVEEAPKKGKRRTPWYVMLPLLVLSLCGAGLAALWAIGFTYLDMDRGLRSLTFDNKVIIGVATAGAVTLLCLIFTLIPARAWLRFLFVLFFLGLGYGGSFAAIHWWNDLPFVPQEKQPDIDLNAPLPGAPGGARMGGPGAPGGGGGRGQGGGGEKPQPQ
jgi:hypothetical protein